jgi:methyl-accepting chemotaxis protein
MRKTSINTVLTLFVAGAVLAAVVILILYVSRSSFTMASDLEEASLLQLAQTSSRTLELYLDDAADVARALSTQDAIVAGLAGDTPRAKERFRNYIESYKQYWAIFAFDMTGKVVAGFNAKMEDMAGGSRADRDYVKGVLAGKDMVFTDQVLSAKTGDILIFVVSKAVHGPDGKLLGGVAVCPKWNIFTKNFIDPMRFGQRGYGFMLDASGAIIAHAADKSLLLKNLADQDFVKNALAQKEGVLSYDWKGERKYMAIARNATTGWLVCMTAYESEMTALAASQRNILLIIGALVLIAVVTGIIFVNRTLVLRPLIAVEGFTHAITEGNLQATLAGSFRFELATLATNLRQMVAELKNKLGFAQGVLSGLTIPFVVSDTAGRIIFTNEPAIRLLELSGRPEDFIGMTASAFFYGEEGRPTISGRTLEERKPITNVLREIATHKGNTVFCHIDAAPIYDLDGNCIAAFALVMDLTEIRAQQMKIEAQNTVIAKTAADATQVADRMAQGAEEVSAQIEQASESAQEQSNRVHDTAAAMEEMNATILEVAKSAGSTAENTDTARNKAREGADLVASVTRAVDSVREEANALKENMHALDGQAQGIGAIMGVISDIADQTNLLALNAAIEAARAGDAGRGFAVVADEVRKLAEKTMNATKEVGSSISGIQKGAADTAGRMERAMVRVAEATELAGRSGAAIDQIVTLIEAAGDQVRSIATAAEQQSATAEEISRAIAAVNALASEAADAMSQSARAVTELSGLAHTLNTLISELQGEEAEKRALS